RYFMDHLVDQLFVFEGDGKIRVFNGNYTDYRDWLSEQEQEAKTPMKEQPRQRPADTSVKKKPSFKEKQEYENLQAEIAALEARKAELEGYFAQGTSDVAQITEWSKEIEQLSKEIDQKTDRWIELSDFMD